MTSTSSRNDQIVALVQSGTSITEVGKRFGISRQRVSQIMHAHGVRFENSRQSPQQDHGLTAYRKGRCRCDEICRPANAAYMRGYTERQKAKGLHLRWVP